MALFIYIWAAASYLTSLVYCVANAEWLAILVIHVLLAPIGVIHGTFIWFNASWF